MTECVMIDRELIRKVSASLHDYKDGAPWGAFDLSALMELDDILTAPQQAAEPVYFIRDNGASKWLEVAKTAYRAALAMPSLCETRILYAGHPPAQPEQPAPIPTSEMLTVWFGSMPESNGKMNWTAILHRGDISEGFTIARSEYHDRVRYDADCVRHLIGELEDEPDILEYDGSLTRPAAPGGE